MKNNAFVTLLILSVATIIFQFLYLFFGFDGGGYAMAPLVLVPLILITDFLIVIINLIIGRKNIKNEINILMFLSIITFYFIYDLKGNFFKNLFDLRNGYATRLMYVPVVFGSFTTYFFNLYLKKN
ncbi:hypothetical protein [Chryseobacterium sp.]|uniref:hypothetical protein n=1 Tax=Chryseobacterium sp. TaxID=1871047 RepID=UPI00289C9D4E|nr:hypothetical protein [Chryseobacterium sp.]